MLCCNCGRAQQLERPCVFCGFICDYGHAAFFMRIPALTLPQEAIVAARHITEAVILTQEHLPETVH